jgi:DNA replication protein DnaC
MAGLSALPAAAPLDDELVNGLRRLKLRRIRQLAPELCITARTQRWRPEEFLRVLVTEECAARDQSNRELRLRTAAFPVVKTLDDFDLSASTVSRDTFEYLSSLEWIATHRNVALVGPPGTGKSHLSVALGRAAVDAGFRVRFFRADLLVEALYRGLADNSVGRVINGVLRRSDLVIVDELGFSPLDSIAANHLFRFVATAYETRSLVITSTGPSSNGPTSFPTPPAPPPSSTASCTTPTWSSSAVSPTGSVRRGPTRNTPSDLDSPTRHDGQSEDLHHPVIHPQRRTEPEPSNPWLPVGNSHGHRWGMLMVLDTCNRWLEPPEGARSPR